MVKYLAIIALTFFACNSVVEPQRVLKKDISIIPKPISIEFGSGSILVDNRAIILDTSILPNEALHLASSTPHIGFDFFGNNGFKSRNKIILNVDSNKFEYSEYMLEVMSDKVLISGGSDVGVFYGVKTLIQLFPEEEGPFLLPELTIRDKPQFEHRGLLLDCSRHFWSVDVIKKYIDILSYYKMNVLHWHLTEDQGWRIEIKKYPKLTGIGAWRKEADGSTYGGFYTQEEIKEVVAYAKASHVTVIPEIEMPGHSLAALAAYPELACTEGPFEVTSEWGVFKDVYCAGEESTFEFLENVLSEVVDLFPSEYIHIGGDESPKYRWENCKACQNRIVEEELSDEHELQAYFIKRIENFLHTKGKKLIGWDEILEGGLSQTSVVQSWRGVKGGIEAAEHGNKVIMSPTSHCYLDYGLDAIDLEKIYSFNPIPAELSIEYHSNVLGAECNMWTEHVPTEEILDSKVLPRMIGLAEALWSVERDYQNFKERLKNHYPKLENMGYAYGFAEIPVAFKINSHESYVNVDAIKADSAFNLYYTINGTEPTDSSMQWTSDTSIQITTHLKMIAVLDGDTYPKTFELPISIHKAIKKPYSVKTNYSPYYTAGGSEALTNGIEGSLDFKDGNWQGYTIDDLEVVIDLKEVQPVEKLSTNFYQYKNSWIFAPLSVEFLVSKDGVNFDKVSYLKAKSELSDEGKFIEKFEAQFKQIKARYVKLIAKSVGKCPDWHYAAGSPAWMFIDEFSVNEGI